MAVLTMPHLTVEQAALLEDLAERWPVGQRVRHRRSAWYGTITPGTSADCPGVHIGPAPAHCVLPAGAGHLPGAVCVLWDHPSRQLGAGDRDPFRGEWPDPRVGPAWMRPGVLWPVGRDVPRRAVIR